MKSMLLGYDFLKICIIVCTMIASVEYNIGDKVEWKKLFGKKQQGKVVEIGSYTRHCDDVVYRVKLPSGKFKNVKGAKLKLIEKAKPAE